jgi:hypothetical protein
MPVKRPLGRINLGSAADALLYVTRCQGGLMNRAIQLVAFLAALVVFEPETLAEPASLPGAQS